MDLIDALKRLDFDISAGHQRQAEIEAESMRIAEELLDLEGQRHCLTEVIRRYGGEDISARLDAHEEDNGWDALTRLDAVERVLALAGTATHVTKIAAELHEKGRTTDNVDLVSAALSDLKNRRGTVEGVGGGFWRIKGGQPVLMDLYSRARRALPSSSRGVSPSPSQGAEGAREGGGR